MRLRTLSFVLGSIFALTAFAADKPVDVRDLMTATEFRSTGLDKLTPQEMAAFNAWLAAYGQAGAASAAPAAAVAIPSGGNGQLTIPGAPSSAASLPSAQPDQHANGMSVNTPASPTSAPAPGTTAGFGHEMLTADQRGEATRISSSVVGTFTGWHGNTIFKLANGQVWQQADSSTYDTTLENPPVVIKRLGFGYLLTLTGHGATVFVKRVQ